MNTRRDSCPSEEELHRLFSEGHSPKSQAHIDSCLHCRRAWRELEKLAELSKELPTTPLEPEQKAQLRLRLMQRAQKQKASPRYGAYGWALAASLSLAFWAFIYLDSPAQEPKTAKAKTAKPRRYQPGITALGAVKYSTKYEGDNSAILLKEGALLFEAKQSDSEQIFVLQTQDAQLSTQRATFSAKARSDSLVEFKVYSGSVELQRPGKATKILRQGQRWRASSGPEIVAKPETAIKPSKRTKKALSALLRPKKRVSVVKKPPKPTSKPKREAAPGASLSIQAEQAFAEGWQALRKKRYLKARSAFEKSLELSPQGPLVEDAQYWRAICLAHLQENSHATESLRDFIRNYPQAARKGEAKVQLGWLLLKQGQKEAARQVFSDSLADPSPLVVRSAQAGIKQLGQTKP